jgi:hypothetical protein
MLYGEGTQAFKRLQEEIMKSSYDETIFAWGTSSGDDGNAFSLLASSPADFYGCEGFVPVPPKGIKSSHYVLTNKGLLIEMNISGIIRGNVSIGRLNCSSLEAKHSKSIAVPLICSMEDDTVFFRAKGSAPVLVSSSLFHGNNRAHVYLHRDSAEPMILLPCGLSIDYWLAGTTARLMITEFYPPAWRGILKTGSVYFPSHHDLAPRKNQKIVFRCKNEDGRLDFAVRLDFTYNRISTRHPASQIKPLDLQHFAAFIDKDMALAELMMEDNNTTKWLLEWQESLDFGNAELGFDLEKSLSGPWVLNINMVEKEGLPDIVSV